MVAAKNLVAVAVIAALIVQLAIAQVTLALTVAFAVAGALSRWRPTWLLGPVVLGLCWATAIGPGRAWSGYLAAARHIAVLVSSPGTVSAHLSALGAAAAHWHRWLPGQTSLALIVASAEAGIAGLLAEPGGTRRPGLLVAVRRCYVRVSLRRGEVATAEGACLGVVTDTGQRAVVAWREAAGGVLVTGQNAAAVTRTGLDLVTAAIQHRKTVLILDLAESAVLGTPDVGGDTTSTRDAPVVRGVTAACADANAPLVVFGSGRSTYEPFADPRADMAADILLSMADWAGETEARRAFCAEYVAAALEVIATSMSSAAEHSILDDLIALLRPGGLDAWAGRASDPRYGQRLAAVASRLSADPSATTAMAEQLASLRRSPAGAGLRAQSDDTQAIDIGLAFARRQVVLFPLGLREHGHAGLMIARLVLADLCRVLADRSGAPADCLVWINGCDVLGETRVAAVVGRCKEAGVATIAGTPAGTAAAVLGDQVNVVAVRGRGAAGLTSHAGSQAERWGSLEADWPFRARERGSEEPDPPGEYRTPHASDWGPADDLGLRVIGSDEINADALFVRVRGPVPRLLQGCQVAR